MNGNFGVASNHGSGVQQPAFNEPVVIYEGLLFEKTNLNSSTRFVARVVHFAGSNTPYVVLARHWFVPNINQWVPTKANIFLPVPVWRALITDQQIEKIEETLKNELWVDEQLAGPGSGAAGANVPAADAGTAASYHHRGNAFFPFADAASKRSAEQSCTSSQTTATGYSPFNVPSTALNGGDDGESDESKRVKHDDDE